MERLKDILYDLSDILITVAIIAIIFFVVTWKLNDVIPTTETLLNSPPSTENTETNSLRTTQDQTEKATEQHAGTPRDQVDVITNNTPLASSIDQTEEMTNTTLSASKEDTSSINHIKQTETTHLVSEDKVASQFIIPYGATIQSIAKDLKEIRLIDNEDDFIQRVIDRDDSSKLLAGTFKLSSSMSTDDIIDTLIGK